MPNTQYTPTAHSNVVGGSSAARVLACPASIRLSHTMPKQAESTFAAEGTALHNCVEHCLAEGLYPGPETQALVGQTFYATRMTQDHIDTCVNPSLDMFDAIYEEMAAEKGAGDVVYEMEVTVEMPGLDDCFGTADIVMTNGVRAAVIDWKFGAGVPVSAFENKQMAFYACGAANSAPDCFWGGWDGAKPEWPVTFFIVQPRINADEPSRWTTDFSWLANFNGDLIHAVAEGLNENATPAYLRGDHCRWCRASAICPAYKGVGEALAARIDLTGDKEVQMTAITPDLLSEWLAKADVVEHWSKSVRKLAMDEAEAGRPPTGMKLVEKLGNTAYVFQDQVQIDRMLARKGLSVADRRKVVPVTPTQANKKLKEMGKKPLTQAQAGRFVNGVALVDEADKRPAIQNTAQKAAEVAKALAAAE